MITPRSTRLIRTAHLPAFRRAVASFAVEGAPLSARDRMVVVPTRVAADLLTTSLERERLHLKGPTALILPTLVTARELPSYFGARAAPQLLPWTREAREILMGVACRAATDAGQAPPFRVRPGLVAEVLRFYDQLVRHGRDVDTFERHTLGRLEGADDDRGARRLVAQTRFLAQAFRAFERLSEAHACVDDRRLREVALTTSAAEPWRHVVVAVGDESRDRHGLSVADWDLLTRVAGLERIDVVVTDQALAGAWHERVHQLLPGIEEIRFAASPATAPRLRVPADRTATEEHQPFFVTRDREDEIADFARWVRAARREDPVLPLEGFALVVHRPLPYVYLARQVLRSANIECQTFDALPLAAEPFAAALDHLVSSQSTNLSASALHALLASPHFEWQTDGVRISRGDAAAAHAFLVEHGYLGGGDELRRLAALADERAVTKAVRALRALDDVVTFVEGSSAPAPAAQHLDALLVLVQRHTAPPGAVTDERRRRARAAVLGLLTSLRDHYRTLDEAPVEFEVVAAVIRRAIEAHTFAPRVGDAGVSIIDDESARFGDFACVQVAGLVDGEWPDEPARNIFYGQAVLRDLGWASHAERTDHVRAAFADLLTLPSARLTLSAFSVEDDGIVSPSPLLEGVRVPDDAEPARRAPHRVLEIDALAFGSTSTDGFEHDVVDAIEARLRRPPASEPRFHGSTDGHAVRAFSLSTLERYQDCPFTYFARDVLGLADEPMDESSLSPRARGRLVHEVFERFFTEWDRGGTRAITVDSLPEARVCFEAVARSLLERLAESDASLERARLFGSAVAPGLVDVVLDLEATSEERVVERRVESRFDGHFSLGLDGGPRFPLRGVVDRIDLLEGRRVRVIDYKTGRAPDVRRALQVPIYALCAQEQLRGQAADPWTVSEALYVAFTGPRPLVPVIGVDDDPAPVLAAARERFSAAVEGVRRGAFPPTPHDTSWCRSCTFASVCRKDYVGV